MACASSHDSVMPFLMSLLLPGTSIAQSLCSSYFVFLTEENLCNACLLLSDNFMLGMSGLGRDTA